MPRKDKKTTPELIEEALATFKERNAIYKDNYVMVGKLMKVLFPNGVKIESEDDWNKWHLFILLVVKLSRFAISNLTHQDSLRDLAVYAFMVEMETQK